MLQVSLVPTCAYHIFPYIYAAVLSYIVPGTWYQPIIPVTTRTSPWQLEHVLYHDQAPRTQNGFGREQRRVKAPIWSLDRRRRGRNRWCFSGVRATKLNAHTTDIGRIIKLKKPTLWASVLGIFSQAPAHIRPTRCEESLSLAAPHHRRLSCNVLSSYQYVLYFNTPLQCLFCLNGRS